jgi:phospholipid transport system substrate-binding protein
VRKPIVSKTPMWKAARLAAVLGLAIIPYPAHAAPAIGGDTVQGLYDALLNTMKNSRTLEQSGRLTQLEPVIRRIFDIASMARLSVGPSWASLTEAQRQQVTESFGRYVSAIYTDRFDNSAGQKLQVIGEQPTTAGVMVRSQIIKANGEPVHVDYMMRRNGDSWLISDIYLDGAISEVATRRSEFAAITEEPGHRRPDRRAQPQGGPPDGDDSKGIVANSPGTAPYARRRDGNAAPIAARQWSRCGCVPHPGKAPFDDLSEISRRVTPIGRRNLMRCACRFLPHQSDQTAHLTTIALDNGGEFRALGGGHTDTLDNDVVDLVSAVIVDQPPIDSERGDAARAGDAGRHDHPVAIAAAAANFEGLAAETGKARRIDDTT